MGPDFEVRFVTDASSVVLIVHKICTAGGSFLTPFIANADLLQELLQLWNPSRFQIAKIRSHQNFAKARCLSRLWDMLGNACADLAVQSSLKAIPSSVRQISGDAKAWFVTEKNWLLEVFRFVLELNNIRNLLIYEFNQQPKPEVLLPDPANCVLMPCDLLGGNAVNFLRCFDQPSYIPLPKTGIPNIPGSETLQLFLLVQMLLLLCVIG